MTLNPSRIIDMASAFYDSCVLFTASDLGVFGKLQEMESATAATLAQELALDISRTTLLLNACVATGLLEKDGDTYRNTPESAAFLVPGSPADLSRAIRYNRDVYPLWGQLPQLIQSGKPVEVPDVHLGDDKERTRTFVMAMHGRAMGIGRSVIGMLDLAGRKNVLDVGGGPGTYSMLIAQANPDVKCTVLDLPGVVAVAGELIEGAGLKDRVHIKAGDYHAAEFGTGYDVINFFGVLHQESPEQICALFKQAYDALAPGGIINVLDMMTDATHTQPKFSALFAVNMALTTWNGWVFSDEELKGWLEQAGFEDFNCRPLPPPMPHWLAAAHKKM